MPEVKGLAAEVIGLYERCKAHNALPCEGGILAQPEWIMQAFDVIEETKIRVRRESKDADFADYEQKRLLSNA